jgi:hypothetical protein
MKRAGIFALLLAGVSITAPLAARAQAPSTVSVADRYVISARAGGVNYVEGSVSITRTNGTSGVLLKRDNVEVGDQVATGADGRAEILLNPGSYVRLDRNSSFEFGATDLEDLTIKLNSGSAIFEVFAGDEFRVSVITPKGKVSLIETGIYRVDVAPNGAAVAAVTKGKAEIGLEKPVIVKDGRTGSVIDGAVAKFDKDKRDEFAEWSRGRSKELIKVNDALQSRNLDPLLTRGFRTGLWGYRNSFGLWIYDSFFGGYCFLPYGMGWRSPYGGWYNNGVNPFYVPAGPARTKRTRLTEIPTTPGRGGAISGSDTSTRVKNSGSGGLREIEAPPYTRISRGSKGSILDSDFPPRAFDNFPSRSTSPSVPVSAPPTTSAPVVELSRNKGNN